MGANSHLEAQTERLLTFGDYCSGRINQVSTPSNHSRSSYRFTSTFPQLLVLLDPARYKGPIPNTLVQLTH